MGKQKRLKQQQVLQINPLTQEPPESLEQTYASMQAAENKLAETLAAGISSVLSVFAIDGLLRYFYPQAHHFAREELSTKDIEALKPYKVTIWDKVYAALMESASRNKNKRAGQKIFHHMEEQAAYYMLHHLGGIPKNKISSEIGAILATSPPIQSAIEIARRLVAKGKQAEDMYHYFNDPRSQINSYEIVAFFSANIQNLHDPIMKQTAAIIQPQILQSVVSDWRFFAQSLALPFITNALTLKLMNSIMHRFRPDSIPFNQQEFDSIAAETQDVQERIQGLMIEYRKHLQKIMNPINSLIFWGSSASLTSFFMYLLFSNPWYAVGIAASPLITKPIVKLLSNTRIAPVIQNVSKLAKGCVDTCVDLGKNVCRNTWRWITGFHPDKEFQKLQTAVNNAANFIVLSRVSIKEDDCAKPCFKISIDDLPTRYRKDYHITRMLALLFVNRGIQIEKITEDSIYLTEAKLNNLEGLTQEITIGLKKIETVESMVIALNRCPSIKLVSVIRNYELDGSYEVLIHTDDHDFTQCFEDLVPIQDNVYKINLTDKHLDTLNKYLMPPPYTAITHMLVAGTLPENQPNIQASTSTERKPKRRHQFVANPISYTPNTSIKTDETRASFYIFSTNFDKRSQKLHPEMCAKVNEKIANDEIRFVPPKRVEGAKFYGGNGLVIGHNQRFNVAYKDPATDIRAVGNVVGNQVIFTKVIQK